MVSGLPLGALFSLVVSGGNWQESGERWLKKEESGVKWGIKRTV